jgi:hypothetical protein
MSLLGYAAITGGLFSVGLGVTVWILRLRMKGLNLEVEIANGQRDKIGAALEANAANFTEYRVRTQKEKAMLVAELEHYENRELDAIEEEPDRKVRIRRRRSWVAGVLSKARDS